MPIHRILPWFEQNASLKSCHEIQQQKRQLTSGETVDGHVDHLEIHNEAVCYQKQALSGYSENHNSRSCGGSFRSLLSSSAAVIQTTPHTALSIYSEKDGNVILVTELLRCLRPNPKLSCIVISNCGGYWVSDFGSVGGFRQVLLLPVRKNMPMDRIPTNRERFLLQGALLTDGVDLWVPDDEMEDSIEIERTTISSRIHNGVCAMLKLPTIKQSSAASKRNTSRNSMDYAPARNATAGWIGSLENSLAKQVRQEEQRRDYQKLIQRSRYFVLRRNHRSLQLVLQNDNLTSGTEKKKAMTAVLAGLRYRAYPRTSSQIGLVSVTLLVEADMRVLSDASQDDSNSTKHRKKVVLRNAHLYCMPVKPKSSITIQCQSAVTPSLVLGDYLTIMLVLNIDGIVCPWNLNTLRDCAGSEKKGVGLSMYVTGSDPFNISHGKETTMQNDSGRLCLFLASFLVPADAMLQAYSSTKSLSFGLPSDNADAVDEPSVLFDCRPPRPVKVDISHFPKFSASELLETVNKEICGKYLVRVDSNRHKHADDAYVGSSFFFIVFAIGSLEAAGTFLIAVSITMVQSRHWNEFCSQGCTVLVLHEGIVSLILSAIPGHTIAFPV